MTTLVVDLDGTIIKSTKRHYLLLKKLLQDNDATITFSSQDYLRYKRNGFTNYVFLTKKLNVEPQLAEKIQKAWIKDIESPKWIATDTLYSDATRFLNKVKQKGFDIIFLTARQKQKNLHKELEDLNLSTFPKQVIVVQKDKTNAFRNIPDNPKIMIGDTEVDYEAANNSNAVSFILGRGLRSPRFLHNIGVNKVYDNLDEIILEICDIYH
ncbi:HAD family hydrolase [Candidatus Saccharibacteria bacterium]|nr:HAD family hydrolase [Candidatus Saccharibacteria bacterium]